jgi:UDP-N-acetylmuramoyl-tripeptide--D-alanyl-D-alanine ligase
VIPLALDEIDSIVEGKLDGDAEVVIGVKIDSRLVGPGDLFVAVGGGAEYVGDARSRGAAATLVPHDAFAAMAALGRAVREKSTARVVGITGSTGKTSTKDILAALCAPHARVVAAEASYNNELGVPLTLCRLEEDTEACILELAMRGLGQIAALAQIAQPHIGVITTVGPAHLELVGSVEAVARAKAELVQALPSGGVAIVPADAPGLDPYLRRDDLEVRRFSTRDIVAYEPRGDHARAVLSINGREVDLELNLVARHHALNTLAALHAYDALGLPLVRAHEGAMQIELGRWRGEEHPLPEGGVLINDAYNANPTSMQAALEHLVESADGRRTVAILGDMAELGPDGPAYHREIGELARALGVTAVLAVGELAQGYLVDGIPVQASAPDAAAAVEVARQLVEPGDCVLVKASRAVGLESAADALAGVAA